MTPRDRLHLGYLAKSNTPLWGAHIQRGDPITDPDMQRWIDTGLIERAGDDGYVATEKCKRILAAPARQRDGGDE
jgi:hypothetical protein